MQHPDSSGLRAPRWSGALLVSSFLAACTGSYDIEVRFESSEARERTVRTEIALVASCDAQTLGLDPVGLLRNVEIGAGPAQPLGTVEQGEYGLYARAIDETCRVVAAGCETISVQGDSSTFTVELANQDLAICDARDCGELGRCMPNPDASVDGGAGVDGADIGPDAPACEPLEDRAATFQPSGRFSSGRSFSCVIAEGRLFCFGDTGVARFFTETPDCASGASGCLGEIVHPSGAAWSQVSVGNRHACAIDERAALFCWGDNASSQLGTTDTDFLVRPVGFPVADVATSMEATCVIKADTSTMHCWGADWGGQTGVLEDGSCGGGRDRVELATRIAWAEIDACPPLSDNPELGRWVRVVGWFGAFCGQHADGRVFCWGAPNNGATGVAEPRCGKGCRAESIGRWDVIGNAGNGHFCGIREGELRCWGSNARAQLGMGFVSEDATPDLNVCGSGGSPGTPGDRGAEVLLAESLAADPVAHPEGRRWTFVDGGFGATCALDEARDIYCWGLNDTANIGPSSNNPQIEPRRLELPDGVVADEVDISQDMVCVRAGDDFYCNGRSERRCAGVEGCPGFHRIPVPL